MSDWNYRNPEGDGRDCRKLVTLEEQGMVWVGVRAFDGKRWLNNGEPEGAKVVAWKDLPEPAKPLPTRKELADAETSAQQGRELERQLATIAAARTTTAERELPTDDEAIAIAKAVGERHDVHWRVVGPLILDLVRAGWQARAGAPREPTAQMFIAGTKALAEAEGSFARAVWYAMWDAAPSPPGPSDEANQGAQPVAPKFVAPKFVAPHAPDDDCRCERYPTQRYPDGQLHCANCGADVAEPAPVSREGLGDG